MRATRMFAKLERLDTLDKIVYSQPEECSSSVKVTALLFLNESVVSNRRNLIFWDAHTSSKWQHCHVIDCWRIPLPSCELINVSRVVKCAMNAPMLTRWLGRQQRG